MKKVYILGESRGAYRTQNFVKLLLDNSDKYCVYYNSFFSKNFFLRYIKSIFINPFIILFSNIIYVSALNVGPDIMFEVLIGRLLGKKVLTEYYVSVYDTVILDRKMFKEDSIFARLALLYDQFTLRLSSKVIFLNQTEVERYSALAKFRPDYEIVPLCVEEREYVNSDYINGKSDIINLCWWGTYLDLHGLDKLLQAMKLLQEQKMNVRLFMFGNSEEKSLQYRHLVTQLKIENLVQIRNDYTFANGKLSEFLKEKCDISLGVFGDCEKAKNVITNKFLDACAMKSIVVTGFSNAVQEFFDGESNIFFVETEPRAIANKIVEIGNMDKQKLRNCVEESYKIYTKYFSIPAFREEILKVIDEI